MKQIVEIKVIVEDSGNNEAENARADIFSCIKEVGYNVLFSNTRSLTQSEVNDAKAVNLWD